MSGATVAVLGDALLDVAVSPLLPIRPGADVPATIGIAPGGQGANVAVRLARRGVAVRLVCALGDDAAGRSVRAALEAEGVAADAARAERTGSVVVLVDGAGERTMLSQRAPLVPVMPPIPAVDWIAVSGYLLLEPEAASLPGALPVGPRRALLGCAVPDATVPSWRATAAALAPDLVIANRDEAHLVPAGSDVVVVTDPTGATATAAGRTVTLSRDPEPAVIDTTGAGDAFAATLLAELAAHPQPWPPGREVLAAAIGRAATVATAVTRVVGAQGRIPGERGASLTP